MIATEIAGVPITNGLFWAAFAMFWVTDLIVVLVQRHRRRVDARRVHLSPIRPQWRTGTSVPPRR